MKKQEERERASVRTETKEAQGRSGLLESHGVKVQVCPSTGANFGPMREVKTVLPFFLMPALVEML